MNVWEVWKKGFYAWESTTSKYTEEVLRSPLVLGPSGKLLGGLMRAKAAQNRASERWWGSLGLPTRHDQERTLHALNQLNSRIIDLEEKLMDLEEKDVKVEKD